MGGSKKALLLLIVCSMVILCLSGCKKSESESYLQLLQEQGITDNSQSHWQNSKSECVQISPSGVFMSEVKNRTDKVLYQFEDGQYKKVAEQAYAFLEFEGKVYYYDSESNIYCYDIATESTTMFLSAPLDISWFGLYNDTILCAGRSGISNRVLKAYTLDGNCEKVFFDKRGQLGQVALIGKFVIFLRDLEAEVYDLEDEKSHYLIWEDGLSDSYMVSDQENLYISVGRYKIKGDYSTSEVYSKWNGLWEISLQDMERDKWDLTKISDQSYSKFYCVEKKLFDENFVLIK